MRPWLSMLRRAEAVLVPLINLVAALLLSALVVLATGADPIEALRALATGAAGDGASIGYTLYYATNFILAGLAVALPFHAGIFNIGGDGQAYIGGLLASLVCLFAGPVVGWAALPLAVLAAAAGGALWALAPAWLFVARGSHVVITTIMFNFIASAMMTFLIVNVLIAPGQSSPESVAFPPATWMPSLGSLLGPSPLNLTFPLALLLAIALAVFLRYSRAGFEVRASGANPEAARAAGISVAAATILALTLGGALWALDPAWLFVARGSHVVITTIMFNFIASAMMTFVIVNVLIAPGQSSPESVAFPPATWMPSLGSLLGPSPLNLTFPLALVLAIALAVFLRYSRAGFEVRASGANPEAARAAGISVAAATILALTLGGSLAGLVAVNELMGAQHRLLLDFPAGYGFMGIAVALMGRNHPLGICLAALFFGALYQGGTELSFEMPKMTRDIVVVIEGLAILFCGALENLFRSRIARWLGSEATA